MLFTVSILIVCYCLSPPPLPAERNQGQNINHLKNLPDGSTRISSTLRRSFFMNIQKLGFG